MYLERQDSPLKVVSGQVITARGTTHCTADLGTKLPIVLGVLDYAVPFNTCMQLLMLCLRVASLSLIFRRMSPFWDCELQFRTSQVGLSGMGSVPSSVVVAPRLLRVTSALVHLYVYVCFEVGSWFVFLFNTSPHSVVSGLFCLSSGSDLFIDTDPHGLVVCFGCVRSVLTCCDVASPAHSSIE
jgi:hypothetical protein